jgi:hypothetical protein
MEKAIKELIKRLSYISADYNTKSDNKLKEDHDLLVGIIRNYLNYIGEDKTQKLVWMQVGTVF